MYLPFPHRNCGWNMVFWCQVLPLCVHRVLQVLSVSCGTATDPETMGKWLDQRERDQVLRTLPSTSQNQSGFSSTNCQKAFRFYWIKSGLFSGHLHRGAFTSISCGPWLVYLHSTWKTPSVKPRQFLILGNWFWLRPNWEMLPKLHT